MSNARDWYLPSGWAGWLAGAVCWGLYMATDEAPYLICAWIVGGLGSILLVLALMAPEQKAEPSPPKEPTPSFPASFFMPFCVCPKCKVEALHWMESMNMSDEDVLKYFAKVAHASPAANWLYSTREEKLAHVRQLKELQGEVLRTCRECGHTWGQNVGLKNGG